MPVRLTFDPEWLAITRAFHPYLSTEKQQPRMPDDSTAARLVQQELAWVHQNLSPGDKGKGNGDGDPDSSGTANAAANKNAGYDISEHQQFWQTAPGPAGKADRNSRQQRT